MKKNDIILIAVILAVAAGVFLFSSMKKADGGAKAVVYVDKEETAVYDLSEEGTYEIKSDRGTNLLVIKDGKADVTEADCPDDLCVKQKEISKNGETIVCLPHRVVVEIESLEESELDAITK